ncbi:MAG: hypothetical protein Fur002_02300 [Anaerolineales bacterium]
MKQLHILFAVCSALAVVAASSFLGIAPAQAAGAGGVAVVSRIDKTHIEITISFSGGIEGDFGGVIGGKYFSCSTLNANTLVCIAQIRPNGEPMLLSIYNKATSEVIFTSVISAPKMEPQEKEPVAPPPACSPQFKSSTGC